MNTARISGSVVSMSSLAMLAACQPKIGFDVVNHSSVPICVDAKPVGKAETGGGPMRGLGASSLEMRSDVAAGSRVRWRNHWIHGIDVPMLLTITPIGGGFPVAELEFVIDPNEVTVFVVDDTNEWRLETVRR